MVRSNFVLGTVYCSLERCPRLDEKHSDANDNTSTMGMQINQTKPTGHRHITQGALVIKTTYICIHDLKERSRSLSAQTAYLM